MSEHAMQRIWLHTAHRYSPQQARRRRRTLSLAILLIICLVMFVAPRVVHMVSQSDMPPTRTHVVLPGDTLWAIASMYNKGEDVRQVIASIKQVNGLKSATLFPGQSLLIPVSKSE